MAEKDGQKRIFTVDGKFGLDGYILTCLLTY